MEFLTDLKSRLSLRSNGGRGSDPEREHWRRLAESEQFLILEIDRTGLILAANEELCRARDADPDEVLGTSLPYLLNVEDRTGFSESLRLTLEGQATTPVLARLLTNTEMDPAVRWSLFGLPDGEGRIGSVLCIGADLTPFLEFSSHREQVSTELTELRESQEQLEVENLALRREVERQRSAAKAARTELASALQAQDDGPIPGLEDHEGPAPTLAQLERRYIMRTLEQTRGRISGKKGAATILGLHPNTLRSRMEKLGVVRMT